MLSLLCAVHKHRWSTRQNCCENMQNPLKSTYTSFFVLRPHTLAHLFLQHSQFYAQIKQHLEPWHLHLFIVS